MVLSLRSPSVTNVPLNYEPPELRRRMTTTTKHARFVAAVAAAAAIAGVLLCLFSRNQGHTIGLCVLVGAFLLSTWGIVVAVDGLARHCGEPRKYLISLVLNILVASTLFLLWLMQIPIGRARYLD